MKQEDVLKALGGRDLHVVVPTLCQAPECKDEVVTSRVVAELTCRGGHSFMVLLAGSSRGPEFVIPKAEEVPDEPPARDAELPELTFPWGKHRGKKISTVESGYLIWCLDQESYDLAPEIEREIRAVLKARRSGEGIKRKKGNTE